MNTPVFVGDSLFNTSCEVLSKLSTEILKKNVVVRFQGEPGVVGSESIKNVYHFFPSLVCQFYSEYRPYS